MDLKHYMAVVTGASRGIGKSIAIRFAEQGANVVLVGRSEPDLLELSARLEELNTDPMIIPCDLSQTGTPKMIIEAVIEKYKRLDILVNNAGFGIVKSFEDTTIDDWEELMAVNARAPFFLCQAALEHLKEAERPVIVNVSSVVGRLGYVNQSAYAASKHALMGFSKVLAKEAQSMGIRVHTVAPGGVKTDMVRTMRPDLDTSNLILPEEIADLVLFLIQYRGNAMIDNVDVRRFNGSPFA